MTIIGGGMRSCSNAAIALVGPRSVLAILVRRRRPQQSWRGVVAPFHRHEQRQSVRWQSGKAVSGSNNDSGGPSASEQHQLFLEQMNELNTEQRQLFGSSSGSTMATDTDVDLATSIRQQRMHQLRTMPENEDTTRSTLGTTIRNDNTNKPPITERMDDDETEEDSLEQLKQDRERLYGFTDAEHTAWANRGQQRHHHRGRDDTSSMAEIVRHRREHFDRLDQAVAGVVATTNHAPTNKDDEWAVPRQHPAVPDNRHHHREGPAATTSRLNNSDATTGILSHVSDDGTTLHMVDVGSKPLTTRIATAETIVQFPPSVVSALLRNDDNPSHTTTTSPSSTKKGPVFTTAITAGIMAAKRTSTLIPLCHPLSLSKVDVDIRWRPCHTAVRVTCQCRVVRGNTGVEMEALVGCTVAALTIYDMVKSVSHDVVLSQTRLVHKEGGKRHFDIRRSE